MGTAKRKQDGDSASDSDAPPRKSAKSKDTADRRPRPAPSSAHRQSRKKTAKKPKFEDTGDESPPEERRRPAVEVLENAEGEKYVDLGRKKRAAVRSFKGQVFVDIREFYGADGDGKPGKKGISLAVEQWAALKRSISTIDSLFAEQGDK